MNRGADMTIAHRIHSLLNSEHDLESENAKASVEKMIYLAYYIGREEGTRRTADLYTKLLAEQKERARQCRYSKMAMRVLGNREFIYQPDYRMDLTRTFGGDRADV